MDTGGAPLALNMDWVEWGEVLMLIWRIGFVCHPTKAMLSGSSVMLFSLSLDAVVIRIWLKLRVIIAYQLINEFDRTMARWLLSSKSTQCCSPFE
jgi:hypothetical protein